MYEHVKIPSFVEHHHVSFAQNMTSFHCPQRGRPTAGDCFLMCFYAFDCGCCVIIASATSVNSCQLPAVDLQVICAWHFMGMPLVLSWMMMAGLRIYRWKFARCSWTASRVSIHLLLLVTSNSFLLPPLHVPSHWQLCPRASFISSLAWSVPWQLTLDSPILSAEAAALFFCHYIELVPQSNRAFWL